MCLFKGVKSLWRPEYGSYMIEGTPGQPYGGLMAHFNIVEANMRYRRAEAATLLEPGEVLMSLTNFPRLVTTSILINFSLRGSDGALHHFGGHIRYRHPDGPFTYIHAGAGITNMA